jgi:hypothetical protein
VFAVLCRAIQSPSHSVRIDVSFHSSSSSTSSSSSLSRRSIPAGSIDRSSTSGWWASPPPPVRCHAAVASSHSAARPRSAPSQPSVRHGALGLRHSTSNYIGKFPSMTFLECRLTVKSEVPRIQRSTGTHAKKGMGNWDGRGIRAGKILAQQQYGRRAQEISRPKARANLHHPSYRIGAGRVASHRIWSGRVGCCRTIGACAIQPCRRPL